MHFRRLSIHFAGPARPGVFLAFGLSALLVALSAAVGQTAAREAADASPAAIREGVQRALPLIQKSGAEYIRQKPCFGCHHQSVGLLALSLARTRGFAVDEAGFTAQLKHTQASLNGALVAYRKGDGQGGGATTAGYGLWTLESGGWKGDETTEAVASFLLRRNSDLDYWRGGGARPPSEGSPFTTTYVSLRGLQTYGTPEQKPRIAARVEQVRAWLERTPAADTEDRVFRLWSLKAAGASAESVSAAARELLAAQREDGGWSQLPTLSSDAYATGSALVALHETGSLTAGSPAYARGVSFLLGTQAKDGSWHVSTRSHPIQTYFESGFPYGKDQFISMAGTCWATAALTLALEPSMAGSGAK